MVHLTSFLSNQLTLFSYYQKWILKVVSQGHHHQLRSVRYKVRWASGSILLKSQLLHRTPLLANLEHLLFIKHNKVRLVRLAQLARPARLARWARLARLVQLTLLLTGSHGYLRSNSQVILPIVDSGQL